MDSSKAISTVVYTSEPQPRMPFCSDSGFSDLKSSYFIEFVQDILYMYKVFEYYFLRAIMCISHISLFDSEGT